MKRSVVEAFNEVIAWFQTTLPNQWPEEERSALVEEAKNVLKRNPEEGGQWYVETAQRIRETGWWT